MSHIENETERSENVVTDDPTQTPEFKAMQQELEDLADGIAPETLEDILAFEFVSKSEEFPPSCKRRPEETSKKYGHFIAYLLLGWERNIIKTVNKVQPKGASKIYSDMKSDASRANNIARGYSPNKIEIKYVQMCVDAKKFEWRIRAVDYDNYMATVLFKHAAANISLLGVEAIQVLKEQMYSAKLGTTRVLAAKALLDKAMPNVATTNVNVAIDSRTSRQLTDNELMQLASASANEVKKAKALEGEFIELPRMKARQVEPELNTNSDIVPFKEEYLQTLNLADLENDDNGN